MRIILCGVLGLLLASSCNSRSGEITAKDLHFIIDYNIGRVLTNQFCTSTEMARKFDVSLRNNTRYSLQDSISYLYDGKLHQAEVRAVVVTTTMDRNQAYKTYDDWDVISLVVYENGSPLWVYDPKGKKKIAQSAPFADNATTMYCAGILFTIGEKKPDAIRLLTEAPLTEKQRKAVYNQLRYRYGVIQLGTLSSPGRGDEYASFDHAYYYDYTKDKVTKLVEFLAK